MSQAQLIEIKLSRFDAQPWGFRLQGGVDFAMPLIVQKVNGGSLAEQAGLMPGDAVIKINDVDVFSMRHKEAQDVVVRSGNNFVMTVQRGGSTWRPHVVPTGQLPKPNSPYLQTVTKTSLAHKQPPVQHIGCGYNSSARPFANCTGGDGSVKSIVNKQYNSPVGIYSDEAIAETLSAQAEILAGGVLGVNFKKNEKEYQPDKSEVLKLLREEESGGQSSPAFNNYQESSNTIAQQQQQQQQQSSSLSPSLLQQQEQQQQQQQQQQQLSSVTRHVTAPVNLPKPSNTGGLPTGQNICYECERLITGVFVRIKDKNLHVECFKCATCGTSLKNQGYYNFNNKLYCDIHAKLAALQSPPAGTEGYVPVPIKPNTKFSASNISSALNAHVYEGLSNGSGVGANSMPMTTPINQGYVRPFGATSSTRPQAGTGPQSSSIMAPKSPIIFPPQSTQLQWDSGISPISTKPIGSSTPTSYATFPRSNFGQNQQQQQQQQQQQHQGRKVQSMLLKNYQQQQYQQHHHQHHQQQQKQQKQQQQCNNNYKPTTVYQRHRTVGPNRYTTIPITYNKTISSNSFKHNKNNYTSNKGGGILSSKGGIFGATTAPKRGRGIINKAVGPGARVPLCNSCNIQIRGPFITALGRIWCPEHFICINANCRRPLQDIGFVEEKNDLYCEYCFEKYLAPTCNKCANKIKGDCLNAIGKHFHPECFSCAHCGKLFGNTPFFLEEGEPYCEADWNELFTTKCYACGFPVEAGDRWVEALNHNYHSQCFNCTFCKQNLEGQSFYNKGGRPFCKNHAR